MVKVNNDFKTSVQDYINTILVSGVDLPSAIDGEKEAEYSKRVSESYDNILLMDTKLVDGIEVCDLFTAQKQFIHIKPWKSSSTLSHLFSQGRIASTYLFEDRSFRIKVKELIRTIDSTFDIIDEETLDPRNYEVIYAIIYKEDKEVMDRIPFFSKVNLMHSARILSGMRFNVSLKHIKIEEG